MSSDPPIPDVRAQGDQTAGGLRDRVERIGDPLALFESLFAQSPVPHLIFAADGYPIACNAAYRELFGQEPPSRYNVLEDQDSARLELTGAARRALLGETVRTPSIWYERGAEGVGGDGHERIAVECSLFPLRDRQGGVAHIAVAYKDVTSQKEIARHRALAHEMPAHVLENMTEAVTLADDRGVLVYTNSTADRMFGYARGELVGKHVKILNDYPPAENERRTAEVIGQLRASGEWIGQWDNVRKDGSAFTTRARITKLVLDGLLHWLCVQDDITEEVAARRHTDALAESLRARERQLRLITDSLPALVTYMGADRRFRFTNNAYMTWFGIEPQSLIGKHARELVGEVGYRQIQPYMERALAGETVHYERDVTLPDGRTIYTEMSYVPDKDEQGHTLGYVALIHDMTDRHRAELELQAERQRLHDILMNAPAAISLRSGPDGVFTFVNATYQALMEGRTMLGRTTREIHREPTVDRYMHLIERVYATGRAVTGTEVPSLIRNPDGSSNERFFNVTYQPLLDAEERIHSVVSFAVEVTEQVNARRRSERLTAALRESEARYRGFVNQSTEGIWRIELDEPVAIDAPAGEQLVAFNRGARLAECNDAMAKMYGYARGDELVDKPLRELFAPEDTRGTEYLRAFVANGYRLEAVESHQPGRDGRTRVFRSSLVGVVDNGWLRRAWGTQRDVTAEVEARQQAEAGNRAKDEFLAMLGHELRNPLAPILTALAADAAARARRRFAQERAIIERQVEHLVRLVDDLLDVSRITRGKVALERPQGRAREGARQRDRAREPADRAARAPPVGRAAAGSVRRRRSAAAGAGGREPADQRREVHRRAAGAIRIAGACGRPRACLRCSDTGIGIRACDAAAGCSTCSCRSGRRSTGREGGLGLGPGDRASRWSSCMGARRGAQRRAWDRAASSCVFLPAVRRGRRARVEGRRRSRRERACPRARRVLVVDDNEDAAEMLGRGARRAGATTFAVAHDGPSALADRSRRSRPTSRCSTSACR